MTILQTNIIRATLAHMSPRTLASFIADLDMVPEYSDMELALMVEALDMLFSVAGHDAIGMLQELDVNACNPLVGNAIDEWQAVAA